MGNGTKALGHECTNGALFVALRAILGVLIAVAVARAETPGGQRVKGELTQIDGLRVLRVWGTPREKGFAQGYLLGQDGINLLDSDLKDDKHGIGAYEALSKQLLTKMKVARAYQEEMEGMVEGFKAKLGNHVTVPTLNRDLEYRDLLAMNCTPETAQLGCSSFAAWGSMTSNGETLAGRNLDWFSQPALKDSDGYPLVVVYPPENGNVGWVSVTWPLYVGCLTGMNAQGVTVSMHDVMGVPVSESSNLTPRGFALRAAIEGAQAETAAEDITRILRGLRPMVGNNVPVAMPYSGHGSGSLVFEYDGNQEKDGGVTLRAIEADSACYQICTNDYRKRAKPVWCERYAKMRDRLKEAKAEGKKLAVSDAWELLDGVAMEGWILTYQSVVFEPNRKLMHIKIAGAGARKATGQKAVTLDVAKLLSSSSSP